MKSGSHGGWQCTTLSRILGDALPELYLHNEALQELNNESRTAQWDFMIHSRKLKLQHKIRSTSPRLRSPGA